MGIQYVGFIYRFCRETREDERRSAFELAREYYAVISIFVCFMSFSHLVPIVSLKNFVQLIFLMNMDCPLHEVKTEVVVPLQVRQMPVLVTRLCLWLLVAGFSRPRPRVLCRVRYASFAFDRVAQG